MHYNMANCYKGHKSTNHVISCTFMKYTLIFFPLQYLPEIYKVYHFFTFSLTSLKDLT